MKELELNKKIKERKKKNITLEKNTKMNSHFKFILFILVMLIFMFIMN